jgi:glycogen operon protein
LSWIDWRQAESNAGREMQAFVARLLALRRQYVSLRSHYFQHGSLEPIPQVRDIEWFDEGGDTMRPEDWHSWDGRLLCLRRAARSGDACVELSLLLINNSGVPQTFQLPQPQIAWWLRLDSADVQRVDTAIDHNAVEVAALSLQLLTAIVNTQQ